MRRANTGPSRRTSAVRARRPFARLRPVLEPLEDRWVPAGFVVTNTLDNTNPGSLRWAMQQANSTLGADTITFNIAGAGVQTIHVTSLLPTITDAVTIDATSQPGYSGTPLIEINGSALAPGVFYAPGVGSDGLRITAGNSVIRGLAINRFGDAGMEISGGAGNAIEGCFLGTDATGTLDRGNGFGVMIFSGGNRIGTNADGTNDAGERNVISGNQEGVFIHSSNASLNRIAGNLIGTDVTGMVALGNGNVDKTTGGRGIYIGDNPFVPAGTAKNNIIGGTNPVERNVISGNFDNGILLTGGTSGNLIQGNYIGTDITGTLDLGNENAGIGAFFGGANNNTIGGTTPAARNIISGNEGSGIFLAQATTTNNVIQGNSIGGNVAGAALGNGLSGVYITQGASNNTLGGTAAGTANVLAFNGKDGVFIDAGTGNGVQGNVIHSNTGLGIDLGTDDVTNNDLGDGDTGANRLQNFPILTKATVGASLTVDGTLNSTASRNFRLEFFANTMADGTNHGEGQTYLGFLIVTTDAGGNVSFSATGLPAVPVGTFISATATDQSFLDTSEFSQVRVVVIVNQAPTASAGGPYTVVEGAALTLDASASNDPDGDPLTYTWDVNGDNVFGDATGVNPTLNWAALTALGINDGPAAFNVRVRVDDGNGQVVTSNPTTLTVNNAAPVLTAPGNQNANEGTSTAFALGSFSDAGNNDNPWTVSVTWGDTGSNSFTQNTQGAISFNHTYQDSGNFTVNVTVTDKDGTASTTISFQVTVANRDPTATGLTGGPGNEGSLVTVSLTGVADPSPVDSGSLRYSFATSIAGLAPDYAGASATNAAVFTFPDEGAFTVFGRVYDKDGGISATFQTNVTINNVAPTVTSFTITGGLNGSGFGTAGSPISFQAAANDPGLQDAFTYQFDWNYNGVTFDVEDTIGPVGPAGRSPQNINHAYAAHGIYQPAVRVLDGDGGTSAIFLGPTVNVGTGVVFIDDGNLVVIGTGENDNITVNTYNQAAVTVFRNGVTYGPFDLGGGGRVIVRSLAGIDVVTVNGPIGSELFGGEGNDFLYGGTGNDQLWGDAGDDSLSLGSGHDLGIGGFGRDQLTGGNGDDVLLGGHVDAQVWNWAALKDVSNQWSSYSGPAGTGPAILASLASATTDSALTAEYDRFWGNTGKDAFLYRSGPGGDQVNDYSLPARDYLLALL